VSHTLTPAAERDIRDILRETLKRFGTRQLQAYQQIIASGIEMVAENPDRPGSLADGVGRRIVSIIGSASYRTGRRVLPSSACCMNTWSLGTGS